MKKLVIWALACIWGIPAWAEGYQVNVLSAKQTALFLLYGMCLNAFILFTCFIAEISSPLSG